MHLTRFFNTEAPHKLPITLRDSSIIINESQKKNVDIVIPVYKGLEQTKKCILSVLNSELENTTRIIIYNDNSPDSKVVSFLNSLKDHRIIIIKNEFNRGFVFTANLGLSYSKENDVILLNSDTEVCSDWVKRLRWHAYTKPNIGTVTPFSNNATLCSYPNLYGFKSIPSGSTLQDFNLAFSQANNNRNISLPTAVGFCVYIRRDCLNEVGYFNAEKFGMGYGEENEFSLRASEKGWIHLLAGDVFIYHEGAVSFSRESNARKKNALTTLTDLYPDYESLIAKHIQKNDVYTLILSAMVERKRQDKRPKILHILHNFGGGTEKHVKSITEKLANDAIHFVITPAINSSNKKTFHIFSTCKFEKINVEIEITETELLLDFLKRVDINLIHVHHVLNFDLPNIYKIISSINKPYYLTIHDYLYICPQITLIKKNGQSYCGEPNADECNNCISENNQFNTESISSWRKNYQDLISNAALVICPSFDVSKRIDKYFRNNNIITVYHEPPTDKRVNINKINLSRD